MRTWKNVEVNLLGIKQIDFKVIEMNKPFDTFNTLLGLRWFVNSNNIIDFRKEEMFFANNKKVVHIPLDVDMSHAYVED